MLLILKTIKIFKKYYQSIVVMWQLSMPVMRTVWRRELVQLTSPHSTHYRHTKHMLPNTHDGLIIPFKYFNSF